MLPGHAMTWIKPLNSGQLSTAAQHGKLLYCHPYSATREQLEGNAHIYRTNYRRNVDGKNEMSPLRSPFTWLQCQQFWQTAWECRSRGTERLVQNTEDSTDEKMECSANGIMSTVMTAPIWALQLLPCSVLGAVPREPCHQQTARAQASICRGGSLQCRSV